MKYFIIALLLLPVTVFAQSKWDGQWKTQVQKIDLYITISDEGKDLKLTIPMQGIADMSADNSEVSDNRIDFFYRAFGASFYGNLKGDSIVGTWNQGGREQDMIFLKSSDDLTFKRPQTPKEPFSYKVETIVTKKTDSSPRLSGTLTMPEGEGPFPAVVLISGSGPQNRDSEIFKHKPFWVLADHFTRKGYAVLRYDERGIGLSGGKFKGATSEDFAMDVESAVQYLQGRKEINTQKIGLVGHSEGGMIAPLVASKNKDIAFIVLLAGPGIPPKEIMKYQMKNQFGQLKLSSDGKKKTKVFVNNMFEILSSPETNDKVVEKYQAASNRFYNSLEDEDQEQFGVSQEQFYFSMASTFFDPWMRYFLQYDPSPALKKVTVPVLAVNGKKDRQVTAKHNIKGIKKALKAGGNKSVKTKCFKNLNHLFQTSKTGNPSEYMGIEETFNEDVMIYIVDWMNNVPQQ